MLRSKQVQPARSGLDQSCVIGIAQCSSKASGLATSRAAVRVAGNISRRYVCAAEVSSLFALPLAFSFRVPLSAPRKRQQCLVPRARAGAKALECYVAAQKAKDPCRRRNSCQCCSRCLRRCCSDCSARRNRSCRRRRSSSRWPERAIRRARALIQDQHR